MKDNIQRLKSEISRLINEPPILNDDDYQFSIFAEENNQFYYTITSSWVEFTEEKPIADVKTSYCQL